MRGRERELQAVTSLLGRAKQGRGGTLLVEGKPGLGKSCLLDEAAAAARNFGFAVAAAAADELTRYLPAGPLRAALGQPPCLLRPEARRGRSDAPMSLAEDIGQHLEHRARSAPLLVCLDDLQSADTATLLALRLLPAQLVSCPIAWILARSSGHRGSRAEILFGLMAGEGATRLELMPLDDEAVRALVADAVRAEPDQALLGLASRAGGNPSLITELVAGFLDEHAITVQAGRARLSSDILPRRMQAAVRRRLHRLSMRARQLVETAAVLGRTFRLEDAAAMLGASAAELLPAVEEALAAEILVATRDALAFRHELYWQALLDGLAPPVRQALHGQFGDLLLTRGSAVQAAPHLIEAAHGDDPQVLARLDQVRGAVMAASPEAAADAAMAALSLTPSDDPARIARSAGAAEALAAADRLGEADHVIRNVLAQPMSGRQEARLRSALASVLHLRGLDAQAGEEAERALAEPGLPRSVRSHATIALLQALAGVCDSRRGAKLASSIRDAPTGNDRDVRVTALIVLAVIRWDEGRMQESVDLCQDAIVLAARKPSDVRLAEARLALASRLVDIRRYDEAMILIKLGRERPGMVNGLEASASPTLLRARMGLAQGRLDDAVAEVETARKFADARGADAYRGYAFRILAAVALRRGDLSFASELEAAASGPRHLAASCRQIGHDITAAQLAEARGGSTAAMPVLSETYEALARHRSWLISEPGTAPWLVRVALAAGQPKLAARAAATAEDIAQMNPGFPSVSASANHASGILRGDRSRLRRARELYGDPWLCASAAEDLGDLLSSSGAPRAETVACLDDALDCYEHSGAPRDAARVRRRLRQAGVRRRHWAAHRGPDVGWASLTETERAISELVSLGLSNQEVANRKYVSVHTVAFHLRQIFRKLGISSRVELARIAVENAPAGRPGKAFPHASPGTHGRRHGG
jgi:DNA-binding CsgD family transcriptional regulator